jgi:hypothetical protein
MRNHPRHVIRLSSFMVLGVLALALLPATDAATGEQAGIHVLDARISGDDGSAEVKVNGTVYGFNVTISTSPDGDPIISTSAGYASFPEYILPTRHGGTQ